MSKAQMFQWCVSGFKILHECSGLFGPFTPGSALAIGVFLATTGSFLPAQNFPEG